MPTDLSKHARTLVEQYQLVDGVFQMRVRATSPFIGLMPDAIEFDAYPGLSLIGLQAGTTGRPAHRARRSPKATRCWSGATPTPPPPLPADKHLALTQGDAEGDRQRHPVQPDLRPGGGRDPAAFGDGGTKGFPRHGDRKRRPHHPGRAAAGRGSGRRQCGAGGG